MIKLFESFQSDEEIHNLCKRFHIEKYIINPDRTISVDGSVTIDNSPFIPLRFKEVSRWFNCAGNNLTSLEGCPQIVDEIFCEDNKLTSFIGGPRIANNYVCNFNKISTFHGFPEIIREKFYCSYNPIFYAWVLFEDLEKIELLNEMDPFRIINNEPHVVIDIFNDFLSIIGKSEVQSVYKYINI